MTWQSRTVAANGQDLHVMTTGPDDGPVMAMLHGFPEYWASWKDVAERLSNRYRCILPDQRGFNLSSKPEGVEAYNTKHMVADLDALLDAIGVDAPVILCGHDWGASVAYAFAMRHADRVSRLVIANGVHPVCFQKGLIGDTAQMDASQYMNVLRAPDAEERMSANGCEKLFRMLEKFSSAPWLTDEVRAAYLDAWTQPGAMTAMLNWYRGSPMRVPKSGTPVETLEITDAMRAKYRIGMPHLLLWGEEDTALLHPSYADLGGFCDDLKVERFPGASHWILHEKPDAVAERISAFLT